MRADKHRTLVEDALQNALAEIENLRTSRTNTEDADGSEKWKGLPALDSLPDIDRRDLWEGIPQDYRDHLIQAGDKALTEEWESLTLEDFQEFSRNGNRVHYEDKYFARTRRMNALLLAECAQNQGRFLSKFMEGMDLFLDQPTWCLPAHNSRVRDAAPEPLPDPDKPVLDLFAGEIGEMVALSEKILRPRLKALAPQLVTRINHELRKRIITPYLTYHFWWMGDGVSPMLNWTPWITQNVLLIAFSRENNPGKGSAWNAFRDNNAREDTAFDAVRERNSGTEPDQGVITDQEQLQILQQAALSCDYFLDEYGDDGCCDEGPQYYGHAGLCLFGCLRILGEILSSEIISCSRNLETSETNRSEYGRNSKTKPRVIEPSGDLDQPAPKASHVVEFQDIFADPLIRNIAAYISNVYVGDGYYINYADSSPLAGSRTAREYLFGQVTDNPSLMQLAAGDIRNMSWEERLLPEENNTWYRLLQAFTWQEVCRETVWRETNAAPADIWYPSVGLMIARDETCTLAAKAGGNADAHNHNDVGSVIVYKDKRPFLIDLGVATYTAKTFSDRRYELFAMQSQYHNLPSFYMPEDGTDFQRQLRQVFCQDRPEDEREDLASDAASRLIMQRDGADYHATDVHCTLDERTAELSMDLAQAYGDHRVRSYLRKVTLDKNHEIRILDTYDGDPACVLSLLTYEKPEIRSAEEIAIGDLGSITVQGADLILSERVPVTDARLGICWKHECYRILISMRSNTLSIILR